MVQDRYLPIKKRKKKRISCSHGDLERKYNNFQTVQKIFECSYGANHSVITLFSLYKYANFCTFCILQIEVMRVQISREVFTNKLFVLLTGLSLLFQMFSLLKLQR
uniref:Transmembrane protein n=1 Tax=Cacopsylla melanoneura TaxID=428564 RepID=A0A8D8ZC42_9HEMI